MASSSKYLTQLLSLVSGINGAFKVFIVKLVKLIDLNQGWDIISRLSYYNPNQFFGSFYNNFLIKSLHSYVIWT